MGVWEAFPYNVRRGLTSCPGCNPRNAWARAPREQRNIEASRLSPPSVWLDDPDVAADKYRLRCDCGADWFATPGSVQQQKVNCPACHPRPFAKWSVARHDAAAKAVGMLWLGDPTAGAATKTWVRCLACWEAWETTPNSVRQGSTNCPSCRRELLRAQRDDEIALVTEIDGRIVGAVWLGDPTVNSHAKTWARCKGCWEPWEVTPHDVQQGKGCRECSVSSFRRKMPAFVYLLVHPVSGAAKIGISNEGKAYRARLAKHRRSGYSLITQWRFQVGADAELVEDMMKKRWRNEDQLLAVAEAPSDGSSETVHTESMPLEETVRRINKLAREQQSFDDGF